MSYIEEKFEHKQLAETTCAACEINYYYIIKLLLLLQRFSWIRSGLKVPVFSHIAPVFVILRRKALINCIAITPCEWRHVNWFPQVRRQRVSFLPPPPPDLFLAPHAIFLGGKSCCFWPEKPISARKSLRISAKTFFFFFVEITWFSLKLRLNPIQE